MNYLYYELDIKPDNIVQVSLDKQANVMLLDGINYQNYRSGRRFNYYGGLAKKSPVNLRPPHQGHWYLVIDTGGNPGTVRVSVKVV